MLLLTLLLLLLMVLVFLASQVQQDLQAACAGCLVHSSSERPLSSELNWWGGGTESCVLQLWGHVCLGMRAS